MLQRIAFLQHGECCPSQQQHTQTMSMLMQVYKATVRCTDGTTRTAAVKVGHPGVARLLHMDFTIMKGLAGWLESLQLPFLRSLPLKETVSQFSASMGAQADLRVEAAHLERFHNAFASGRQVICSALTEPQTVISCCCVCCWLCQLYGGGSADIPHCAHHPLSAATFSSLHLSCHNCMQARIPVPFVKLVSESVLVESFEAGEAVSRYIEAPTPMNTSIVSAGVNLYLKMLLEEGFVHSDMHPGNILCARSQDDKPSLALLDCGLAAQLSPEVYIEPSICSHLLRCLLCWPVLY